MGEWLLRRYTQLGTFFLTSAMILIVGHYILGLRAYVQHSGREDIDSRAFLPVYADFPDREALWKDADRGGTHFLPYVHWQRNPFTTKYITVEPNGLRRTVKHPNAHAKKVFVMGGSTIWGTGSPDDMTIPSLLQASFGPDYDVYNFGETGYVSTQELNQLLKALADGEIPDYVIFFDGNNDGYAGTYSPGIPRDPLNVRKEAEGRAQAAQRPVYHLIYDLYDSSNYSTLFWRLRQRRTELWDRSIEGQEAVLAKKVVDYYEAHVRQVKALAKEYGFKVYFFWQPNLFNPQKTPMLYERDILEKASPVFIASQRQVYEEAKKRLAGREREGIFFVGDVLNELPTPVYLDWSHTSPGGNRILADAIFAKVNQDIMMSAHVDADSHRVIAGRKPPRDAGDPARTSRVLAFHH